MSAVWLNYHGPAVNRKQQDGWGGRKGKENIYYNNISLTTNGSKHSCCLLMAYRLSRGILQGPSRLQASDRKLSRASQSTAQVSDQQGGNASTIRTLAGWRGNEDDQKTKLPGLLEELVCLFLLSIGPAKKKQWIHNPQKSANLK